MNAHELREKIKNNGSLNQEQMENVTKWCFENLQAISLEDLDNHYLYDFATRYLMKSKLGKWTKEDASVVVSYLSKKAAWKFGIDENITIAILDTDEYEEKHGKTSSAVCVNNGDDTFNICYSPKVIDELCSNKYETFLRGLQTTFHEVIHGLQNSVIQRENLKEVESPKTKTTYLMALETIARKQNPDFYDKNYARLLKENHAEKIGLSQAMETLSKYNPGLYKEYDQAVINKRLAGYDKNYYDATITLDSGKEYEFAREVDKISSMYIQAHPEMVQKYPILQVGYNLDGTKKDIVQLIKEREIALKNSETPEKIDEMYEFIANHRNVMTGGLKGTMEEITMLSDYIKETGTEDEFVFRLLRFKLENRTNASPEKVEIIMKGAYDSAAKTRQKKQKQNEIATGNAFLANIQSQVVNDQNEYEQNIANIEKGEIATQVKDEKNEDVIQ